MTPTRICLVRHGETAWNAERRLQGHTDTPLNAVGLAQAEATARGLAGHRFDAIYASDLARAWQTAQAAARALGLAVHPEPQLRERRYGAFQGLTYDEARARYPEDFARFEARDPHHRFAGEGETLAEFAARIDTCLHALADRHPGQTLLLVAHGGVLDVINRIVRGMALSTPRDFVIPNAALNWIEWRDEQWRLLAWAEQAHLEGALDELPG